MYTSLVISPSSSILDIPKSNIYLTLCGDMEIVDNIFINYYLFSLDDFIFSKIFNCGVDKIISTASLSNFFSAITRFFFFGYYCLIGYSLGYSCSSFSDLASTGST